MGRFHRDDAVRNFLAPLPEGKKVGAGRKSGRREPTMGKAISMRIETLVPVKSYRNASRPVRAG